MAASLTETEFAKHVGTKFLMKLEDRSIDLELIDVKGYLSSPNDQTGMERFSAFFKGPKEFKLPQRLYVLSHQSMGEFEIFLVPVAIDDQGSRYEAVFNYFKK